MIRFSFLTICVLLGTTTALIGGCANQPKDTKEPKAAPNAPPSVAASEPVQPRGGERELGLGQRAYEDADYNTAARLLRSALTGRLSGRDRATAHKYLAFMSCAQSQFDACRAQFRNAFEANPQFELTQTESGHPLWGPVYREVAADVAKKRVRK
jgi:Tfp pilus assembly protein PilF